MAKETQPQSNSRPRFQAASFYVPRDDCCTPCKWHDIKILGKSALVEIDYACPQPLQ
jgi:hypothetical protein